MGVSVVVPVYNCGRYLGEAIESILDQCMPVDEVIIIDDCSEDDTGKIAKSYADNCSLVKLLSMSFNSGAGAARNKGIELASNDWILFFDGDDIAERHLLATEWAKLQELGNNGGGPWVLAHSSYIVINGTGEQQPGVHRWRQIKSDETLGYQFLRNHVITTSGVLVKRQKVLEVGGFDPDLRVSEDADLWLKLAMHGGFAYVDEPLVRVRRHDNNTSRVSADMLQAESRVIRRYCPEFIRSALHRRSLPWEENEADFVSILFRMDLWEEGYQTLVGLLDQGYRLPKVDFLLGLYYIRSCRWYEAEKYFRLCLELSPHHAASLNNLAVVLAISGKYVEAEVLLKRALDALPEYLDASHNICLIKNPASVTPFDYRFTWRELRETLLRYVR